MAVTFANFDEALKEDYKPLVENLNDETYVLSQIESNTNDVQGRRFVGAAHLGRSSGVGARGAGVALPTAGNQVYQNTAGPLRYNYGRIEIPGPIIAATQSDRGSFVRAASSEMERITADVKRDVNRQVWGTSNGVIATCGVTSASTTVVLATSTTETQMRQLFNDGGMVVDIGVVATPTSVATARTVTARSAYGASPTITISGAAVTTAGTDFVFRTSAGGASSGTGSPGDGQFELTGLQSIVDSTGTLFTINPSTYPTWASWEDGNSGTLRFPAEALINRAIMQAGLKSGRRVNSLVCGPGVHSKLAGTMQAMRRNVDNVDLKAGYSGLRWDTPGEGAQRGGPITLVWDQDCPENSVYGLDFGRLVQYEMSGWDWMDRDGSVLARTSGYDAYEATLFKYHELAPTQRNSHFKVVDLESD